MGQILLPILLEKECLCEMFSQEESFGNLLTS